MDEKPNVTCIACSRSSLQSDPIQRCPQCHYCAPDLASLPGRSWPYRQNPLETLRQYLATPDYLQLVQDDSLPPVARSQAALASILAQGEGRGGQEDQEESRKLLLRAARSCPGHPLAAAWRQQLQPHLFTGVYNDELRLAGWFEEAERSARMELERVSRGLLTAELRQRKADLTHALSLIEARDASPSRLSTPAEAPPPKKAPSLRPTIRPKS